MSSFRHLVTRRFSFCIRKSNSAYSRANKFCTISNEAAGDSKPQPPSAAEKSSFITFDEVLKRRRTEASKSVVIQVKDDKSYGGLYNYMKKYGSIKNCFFYSLNPQTNYILIEFENQECLEAALADGQYAKSSEIFPTRSPFLWFRQQSRSKSETSSAPELQHARVSDLSSTEVQTLLAGSKSFAEDMITLHENVKLNELGSRLRFLTAHQVETAFKGMFPFCTALPFGSSINGFGKINCDLDLVLTYDGRLEHEIVPSRLMYHSKSCVSTSRMHSQRHLEIVADILQYFLPGCTHVRRILQARVPILRYKHDITDIDCDLSATNMSGVYMSELLYILGSYDRRVCPLVYTVRYWAKEIGLTNPSPGRWITNFSLTLLVLFYLQHEKIIPTLKMLMTHKRPVDKRSFDDIDCSFLRDINLLPKDCTIKNESSLVVLLYEFFQFYSSFDFGSYAISLNTGSIISKPEYSALYIVNPLEKHLNVSKNVSPDECERIKMQFRAAAWSMECASSDETNNREWGLLDLVNSHVLRKSGSIRKQGSMKQPARKKLTVQELFDEGDETMNWKMSHSNSKKQPV